MNIGNLIFLPIVEDLRTWFLNQKKERERKKMLGADKDKVRIKPFTPAENEQEMKKFLLSGSHIDENGNKVKTRKLGRSVQSYYRE